MKTQKKTGGAKKIGRNKRNVDGTTRAYVLNKISFEQYAKEKGIKPKK